jgi:hypothetical protein
MPKKQNGGQTIENGRIGPVFEWSTSLDHFINKTVINFFLYNKTI